MGLIVFIPVALLFLVMIACFACGVALLAWQVISYLDKGTWPAFTGLDVIKSVARLLPYDPLLNWVQTPGSWKGVHDILLRIPGFALLFLMTVALLWVGGKILDRPPR